MRQFVKQCIFPVSCLLLVLAVVLLTPGCNGGSLTTQVAIDALVAALGSYGDAPLSEVADRMAAAGFYFPASTSELVRWGTTLADSIAAASKSGTVAPKGQTVAAAARKTAKAVQRTELGDTGEAWLRNHWFREPR